MALCERERRAVERRLKAAGFPASKTLAEFDFDAQPSINKPLVLELAKGDWVDKRESLLMVGPTGTGKKAPAAWRTVARSNIVRASGEGGNSIKTSSVCAGLSVLKRRSSRFRETAGMEKEVRLDDDDIPIPGFGLTACVTMADDDVDRVVVCARLVAGTTWLRIELKDANPYSFQVATP